MSEPEVQPEVQPEPVPEEPMPRAKRSADMPVPPVAPVVANEPGLLRFIEAIEAGQVAGELQSDRWSWVYAGDSGNYSVLPDKSETLQASARICLEGNLIVAWEPL